jgi:heparin binding hemagglutinin HbhA
MTSSTPSTPSTPPVPEPDGGRSAEAPSTPLLAALGAGNAAVAAVAHAFADAFSAASTTQKSVQQRVADLPAELEALRGRFSGDELRRAVEAYLGQVERAYTEFAGRGEQAWGRLRERPQVRQAITTLEDYTGRLDAHVDGLVDEAHEAAARVLAAANRQTRATGERAARTGQRYSGRAAAAVVDASAATSTAVEDAGAGVAEAIDNAGADIASATRTTTRKASATAVPPSTTAKPTPHDTGDPTSN